MIVVNPANGAGPAADPDYRRAIGAVQAHGRRVLGYVPTTWGARSLEAAVAESDRYRRWYGVDGIFADEVASDPRELPYYRTLSRQARAAGAGLVVLNPGAVPDPGYFDIADVIVPMRGPPATTSPKLAPRGPSARGPRTWSTGRPASRPSPRCGRALRPASTPPRAASRTRGARCPTTSRPSSPRWEAADDRQPLVAPPSPSATKRSTTPNTQSSSSASSVYAVP